MNKHTKGPWNIYFASQDNFVIRKMFADGQEAHVVARCHSGGADARLIAAAPELLEQLQDVLARIEKSEAWWMDCPDRGGFDVDAIRSTIAKATGEKA